MAFTPTFSWDFRTSTGATAIASRRGSYTLTENGGAPTYTADGVEFTTATKQLVLTLPSELKYTSPFWIMAKVRRIGSPNNYAGIVAYGGMKVLYGGSPPATFVFSRQSSLQSSSFSPVLNTDYIITMKWDGADVKVYEGTTLQGTAAQTTAFNFTTDPYLYLGEDPDADAQNPQTRIAWVVAGTGDISTGEMATIQANPDAYIYDLPPAAVVDTYHHSAIIPGSTSVSRYAFVQNADGTPATSLTYATSGLKLTYTRAGAAAVAVTPATQTAAGAWAAGGFVPVDGTNCPGLYRIDWPDEAFIAGSAESVMLSVTGTGLRPFKDVVPFTLSLELFGGAVGDTATVYGFNTTGLPTMTAGQLNRRLLQMTSGACAGERVLVVGQTSSNVLQVAPPFTTAPAESDTFVVL